MNDIVDMTVRPIVSARHVTCWYKDCAVRAGWLIHLSSPIVGAPLIALCDAHLYDFETSTQGLDPE
jgi:hypothetical protein